MKDLKSLKYGEEVPENSWVAIFCRATSYDRKTGLLKKDAIYINEDKKYIPVNVLFFKNIKNRSKKWMVRRLIQTLYLDYHDGDFFIVINTKLLRSKLYALVKYEPKRDMLNHVALYSDQLAIELTKNLARQIIELVNSAPKQFIYFVREISCKKDCIFSRKNI